MATNGFPVIAGGISVTLIREESDVFQVCLERPSLVPHESSSFGRLHEDSRRKQEKTYKPSLGPCEPSVMPSESCHGMSDAAILQ